MPRRAPRTVTLLLLALFLFSSCSDDAPGDPGTVRGHVFAGPTCPVEGLGQDCDPQPWQGVIRATAVDGSVFETTSDATGAYSLEVPPGSYVIVAGTDPGGPPTGIPADATVTAAGTLTLDLEVDTGIR